MTHLAVRVLVQYSGNKLVLVQPFTIIDSNPMLLVLDGKLMMAFATLGSKLGKELPLVTPQKHSKAELLDG